MRYTIILAFLAILLLCLPVSAEENIAQSQIEMLKEQLEGLKDNLEQLKKDHDEEVMELRKQIQALEDGLEAGRRAYEPADVLYEQPYYLAPATAYGAAPASGQGLWQSFNPDISIIADMLGQYTDHENDDDRPDDEFIFRELEMNFSGVLDPFARADVVVAIHKEFEHEEDEHGEEEHEHESPRSHAHSHDYVIDIEEAYLTTLSLPHGLQARVGRMKERFGKVNPVHLHALPWVDYPLVIKNYLGDEGLIGDGAEISWLAPTDHYLELVYEVFNNNSGASFAGEEYDDIVHLAHAKNLFELSDTSTIELGGTVATAPNDSGHGGSRTWLEGVDLTLKWKPLEEGLYKGLTWQTEALFSQKDTDDGEADTWGLYSSLEYQFARQWRAALRYDYSEFPDFESFREHGYSAYLTFAQSEYVFWRLGYMFVDRNFADPVDEDEHLLWVQLDFGLGPHRAHAY